MAIQPIGQSSGILQVFRQNQVQNTNQAGNQNSPKKQANIRNTLTRDTVEISQEAKLAFQAAKEKKIQQKPMSQNMEFLQLQNTMQQESRQFNSVSNALKTRHDSSMKAIKNMN